MARKKAAAAATTTPTEAAPKSGRRPKAKAKSKGRVRRAVKVAVKRGKRAVRRAAQRVGGFARKVVERVRRRKPAGAVMVVADKAPISSKRRKHHEGLMPTGPKKGREYLTMGIAVVAGGVAVDKLDDQAEVKIPFTEATTVKRGTIAMLVLAGVAVGYRKRNPRVARHAAAALVGGAVAKGRKMRKGASGTPPVAG